MSLKKREVTVSRTVIKKNILALIKIDHRLLRESIPVLLDEDALSSEKKRQLERFLFNLNVHSKAEEKSLYNALTDLQDLRPKILEGFEEHNMAKHLDEEETELFPKIKNYLTKSELENLGVIYLKTRKDLRRELENRFTLPSLKLAALAGRVSSFVSSKFSVSR